MTRASADGAARPGTVAVIGGGLAGMAAALACADAGVAVTLFEGRRGLGGAASSQKRGELTIDTGQHVFLRCCTAYRAFLERIGGAPFTTLQERMDITVVRPYGPPARLRRAALPAPLHLGGALACFNLLSPAERLAVARGAMAVRRLDPYDPALDAQSLGAWLIDHGQSERVIRRFWDLFVLSALNARSADASLGLAVKVLQTGLLERADAGDIGMAAAPLVRLHDDLARRTLAAAGVDVRRRVRVRAIEQDSGGWRVSAPDADAAAGAVVLAVPPGEAAALLPEGALDGASALAELGASPIVNIHVVYDRRVMPLMVAAATDSPVQWVFDRTRAAGLARGQYLAVSLSAADEFVDASADTLRKQFLPALAALFPAARGAAVDWFGVTRERQATFRQRPGSARLRPGPATRLPGLYLAGAWTDTGWPATMESAVRSGSAAARLALKSLGRQRPHPTEVRV